MPLLHKQTQRIKIKRRKISQFIFKGTSLTKAYKVTSKIEKLIYSWILVQKYTPQKNHFKSSSKHMRSNASPLSCVYSMTTRLVRLFNINQHNSYLTVHRKKGSPILESSQQAIENILWNSASIHDFSKQNNKYL